jgi:hypothetical protein
MGAYANPQGFIDTQSGQHWRDLAASLANSAVNIINAKKAKDKEAADEIKKNKEKFAKDQMAIDQWTIEQKSRIHAVSQKGGTVEWDATYDKWIQEAADIRLKQLQGDTDPALRKKLIAIQTSVEDYANGIANLAGINETYTKKKGLYGKEGGLSATNDSKTLTTLDLLSGKLPSKGKRTTMEYDPTTGTMSQMIYVTDIKGKEHPLSITDINKMASDPDGFGGLTLIPEVTKSIDVVNVEFMNNAKGTTKNAKGETEVNKQYADSFIDKDFTGEINGVKYVNGVGTIERQVGSERVGGKDVATNWEQTKVYALDVNKIIGNAEIYKTKTMAEADALLVNPSEAKAAWAESIKPQLEGMSKDAFLPQTQRDEIKTLLERLDGCADPTITFTAEEKEMVKEGYFLLSKGLLTKQNRVQEAEEKISVRKTTPEKVKTKKESAPAASANTAEMVTNALNGTHVGQITTNIGNRNRPSLVTKNARGLYDVTGLDGDPIKSNMTYDQMKLALEEASAPAAKKIKK